MRDILDFIYNKTGLTDKITFEMRPKGSEGE